MSAEIWRLVSRAANLAPLVHSFVLAALLSFGSFSTSRAEPLEEVKYRDLVAACRREISANFTSLFVAADKSFVCFDGDVRAGRDYALIDSLRSGGAFVVRSHGGDEIEGLKIAAMLQRKQVTMVVYDYCLSACASFFLIAAERVHVVRNSIVAWHEGTAGADFDCIETAAVETPYGRHRQLTRSVCKRFLVGEDASVKRHRQVQEMETTLYWKRTKSGQFRGAPQSIHIRRKLLQHYDATGRYPEVMWMWNPRHYKSELKSQVTYEAYPQTQEEVDRLAARFGLGPILHDP